MKTQFVDENPDPVLLKNLIARFGQVNVYQDAGNSTANRVKIDLDRDDKWDEKIDFKPEGVIRQVAPNDDEKYTETYHLVDGAWVKS